MESSSSSSVIFLGTGCSRTLPNTRCLLRPSAPPCVVCSLGVSLPPEQNPNYRSCMERTLDAVKRISPKRALLIGMRHEFEHYRENQNLAEWSSRAF
uniref:Uncharacterized protein n=1 Tax=Oryza nivara TaxID=4536 RepID=A0A0E0G4H6_ORYNI